MTDERLICSVLKAALKSRRKKEKKDNPERLSVLVAPEVIFSHQFLEDLEKLRNMRHLIPDPSKFILPPNKKIIAKV